MTKKLDVFSMQIVANYLRNYTDFDNIICVCKKFEFILDRFRINPIPLTSNSKRLFKYIETQQLFF